MADVVDFPARPQQIWVCECGCASFDLRSNGTSSCSVCGLVTTGDKGGWFDEIADGPDFPADQEVFRDFNWNGSIEFARHQILQAAADKTARAVVVVWQGERMTCWLDADNLEDQERLSELIDQNKDVVRRKIEGFLE